jgi:N-acetyl-anhydromuramyl-L-alanine amidase AmpD
MSQAVDEPGAIPMFVDESRVFIGTNDHTWVVLHKTASPGPAQAIAAYFQTNSDMHSTHYVVGQDGVIVQCVYERDGAGGNCCIEPGHAAYLPTDINLNLKTISIEHVDPAPDNSTPLTPAQAAASFRLVRDICQRWQIPMRRGDAAGGIIGHGDIAPVTRARCPGNYPWEDLFAFLEAQAMLQISDAAAYFTDLGPDQPGGQDVWRASKSGLVVGHAILAHYRSVGSAPYFGLALYGLPRTNEIAAVKSVAGVTFQVFERGILCYDPAHALDTPPGAGDVYPMHIDGGQGAAQLAQLLGLAPQSPSAGVDAQKLAKVQSLMRQLSTDTSQLEAAIAQLS